jgi:hypothetical protein
MKSPLLASLLTVIAIAFMFSAAIPNMRTENYTYEASLGFRCLFVAFSVLSAALIVKTK